jgi:hypothetical protein
MTPSADTAPFADPGIPHLLRTLSSRTLSHLDGEPYRPAKIERALSASVRRILEGTCLLLTPAGRASLYGVAAIPERTL